MIDMTKPFLASQAAEYAGVKPRTLQDWVGRNLVLGHRVDGGGGKGRNRHFHFTTVLAIACANAAVRSGIVPAKAFKAVEGLAMSADERHPGLPYRQDVGETFLVMAEGRAEVACNDIPDKAITAAIRKMDAPACYTILNVSQMFGEVCARMGIEDPGKALDEVYAESS